MHRLLVSVFAITCCFSSFAETEQSSPSSSKQQPGYINCPSIDQLMLDKSTFHWHAKGGWKTFTTSFSTKITNFLGAQWQGVNLGNVICIYKGNGMTFNINLQHPGLVINPKQGAWTKNLGGYKDCVSHNIYGCPFKSFQQKQTENIYQTLDSLKTTAPQQIGY